MSKTRYIVKKTVITLALIWGVVTALFFFFRFMPGDYTDILIGQGADPSSVQMLREQWGLDEPLHVQYVRYMQNLLTGSAGFSFRFGNPVIDVVTPRIINSAVLIAPGIITAYVIGSIYGTIMGVNRGSYIEKYGIIPVTIFGTIPEFFLAILLIAIFAEFFGIFPVGGIASISTLTSLETSNPLELFSTTDFWYHYILPFSAVVLRYLYYPSLIMRTSVVEVAGQDFSYYHAMKGLPKVNQLRHTMKHASLPVITVFPVSMTRAIGGMVLIEVVFNWPGIGNLLVQSVFYRDFPIIQFVFFLVAVWVIIGNFFIDIIYGIIDPRISLGD